VSRPLGQRPPCDCGDHEGLEDSWHDSQCPYVTGVPRPLVYDLRFVIGQWELELWVPGRPTPQGSKVSFYSPKARKIITKEDSDYLAMWRADIRAGGMKTWGRKAPLDGPLLLIIEFVRRRPVTAPKRKPVFADTAPDLDKLTRAVGDGLESAGVVINDARFVTEVTHKRVADLGEAPGAHIRIARWNGGWRR
jgi:Holliday junction resolvase RusA-like endonuclease